jgi:hypothetical protein
MIRLTVIGAGFGIAANPCFATTGTAAGLFAGQIPHGGVWGIFATLGIIIAQRLLPTAVATASRSSSAHQLSLRTGRTRRRTGGRRLGSRRVPHPSTRSR